MEAASFWSGKTALVTGAGGFIGSHLTEALAARGVRVRAFVRYNSRNHWGWLDDVDAARSPGIEIVRGDLADSEAVRRAVRGCEIVFHLGALVAIPYSYLNPGEFVTVNVVGTAHLLDAARDLGVRRFVQTSTSEVYGTARYVPMDEEHPLQAQSPYAATKIAAEKLAESYYRSFELPVTVVRPFNTYGPRQSTRAVIPAIIAQALAGGPVALGSTSPVRDFTYVADTVEGFLRAAQSEAAIGETLNLGSGVGVSIEEVGRRIFALVGVGAEVALDPARVRPKASEVHRLIASATRARERIGWAPRVSLDEGLQRTIAWFREHGDARELKPRLYAV